MEYQFNIGRYGEAIKILRKVFDIYTHTIENNNINERFAFTRRETRFFPIPIILPGSDVYSVLWANGMCLIARTEIRIQFNIFAVTYIRNDFPYYAEEFENIWL